MRAFVYDAAFHCEDCARKRWEDAFWPIIANTVTPAGTNRTFAQAVHVVRETQHARYAEGTLDPFGVARYVTASMIDNDGNVPSVVDYDVTLETCDTCRTVMPCTDVTEGNEWEAFLGEITLGERAEDSTHLATFYIVQDDLSERFGVVRVPTGEHGDDMYPSLVELCDTEAEAEATSAAAACNEAHSWGDVARSHMAGTLHRKCERQGCTVITLDLNDEDEGY